MATPQRPTASAWLSRCRWCWKKAIAERRSIIAHPRRSQLRCRFPEGCETLFPAAHEQNPVDPSVDLKLGWTNNMLHDDTVRTPLVRHRPPKRATPPSPPRRSAPTPICTRTSNAPHHSLALSPVFFALERRVRLRPDQDRIPPEEAALPAPYVSVRLIGDARRSTGGVDPQSLSESAFILGPGVATNSWHGAMAWFEAGTLVSYLDLNRFSDYRGGISFARTAGRRSPPNARLVPGNHGRQSIRKPLRQRSPQLFAEPSRLHLIRWGLPRAALLGQQRHHRPEAPILGEFLRNRTRASPSPARHAPSMWIISASCAACIWSTRAIPAGPTTTNSAPESGMRLRSSLAVVLSLCSPACLAGTFAVIGPQAGAVACDSLLRRPHPGPRGLCRHLCRPARHPGLRRLAKQSPEGGAALILEGASPLAASFGFRPGRKPIPVIHLVDVHNPSLPVIWGKRTDLPRYDVPAGARVFAKDRWTVRAPVAGYRFGAGAVLWVAASPGPDRL